MSWNSSTWTIAGVLICAICSAERPAQQAARPPLPAGIRVWDTASRAADVLAAETIAAQSNWRRLARNAKQESFEGDAVISNGRVLAAVRQRAAVIDLYSIGSAGLVMRAQLRLQTANGHPAQQLARVELSEHTRSAVGLRTTFRSTSGEMLAANFRLKRGGVALAASPLQGAASLHVDCPGRFVVLPDFFADDIVIDARQHTAEQIAVPSEHFLLHLTGEGDAIAMCVFENREQDVQVSLAGEGRRRVVSGSEIKFGQAGKIWVALLAAPQVWHTVDVAAEDAQQIKPLAWKMPFIAQWRIDFTRPDELIDSWEFLLPNQNGQGYLKPNWMTRGARHISPDRKRWTTVLGRFKYPCWTDPAGRGYLQPLKHPALSFAGPAVVYPLNRVEQTPTDTYTVVDVMRNCLGVGPCEYILNVEGQKQDYKGRATCATRDALLAIYRSQEQKRKAKEIETALQDVLVFVTHIRSRISQYIDFGHRLRRYLAEQKQSRPELATFVDEMDRIVSEIDARVAARKDKIRTPQYVAAMNEDFRRNLLGYAGNDAEHRLTEYTNTLTEIGGNQDELVGECRWIVKRLRQRAGVLAASDSTFSKIAAEVRARSQQVLLKPSTYEGVRH